MASIFCHYHPDAELIEDNRAGDIICTECGIVVGDRMIDVGTEWRTFANEGNGNDPSRVGAPENPLFGFNNLSTNIKSGFGASESTQKLAAAQNRNNNAGDKQMNKAIEIIGVFSERIHGTRPIQDLAAKTYKQLLDTKTLSKHNCDAKAAACLYFACRKEGVPRTYEEIVAVSNVTKKVLGKCVLALYELLKIRFVTLNGSEFVSRFCCNLNLHVSIQAAATKIAQKADELNLSNGKSPVTIAAAAIYLASQASDDKRSVNDIRDITGAAASTIQRTYKLLLPHSSELIPDC